MQLIPIQAVPSQTLTILLANQSCQLNIYQRFYGVFMDVYVNNAPIILGVLCENINRIVRSKYLNFVGDFVFIDNAGNEDPQYLGLGSRWSLIYLEASDVAKIPT